MLKIVPMSLKDANAFVDRVHRHHKHVTAHKFSIGVEEGGAVVGVAIVGRPVARYSDDGWTLEVARLATDGTKNACSILYAAAARAARAMGYRKVQTYILESEPGTSLRAAGWRYEAMTNKPRPGQWGQSREKTAQRQDVIEERKQRWAVTWPE
jgi:hypothetical protein